jgi:thioredoxin-like negative regulator of GroEL
MKRLLFFQAAWCGPCNSMKPLMESLLHQIPMTFIDVDASPQTAAEYSVRNVPTVILIDGNGREKGRLVGVQSESQIRELYNR